MQPPPPASKPRRPRHLGRWILAAILAAFGWYGWKAYDFHLAMKEAKALGWLFGYTNPFMQIRADWRAAFRLKTWNENKRWLGLQSLRMLNDHPALVKRLNPDSFDVLHTGLAHDLSQLEELSSLSSLGLSDCGYLTNIDAIRKMNGLRELRINSAPHVTDFDALHELKNLRILNLRNCRKLTNVDPLRGLTALESLDLSNCTGLTNVDGLLGLTQLKTLDVSDCAGLSEETLNALKAALANTKIRAPQ